MSDTSTTVVGVQPAWTDKPVKNLRIRFWGVQGSCALFPDLEDVGEYKRLITVDVLTKVLKDLACKSNNGSGCTVEQLIGGPISDARMDAYQSRLNLENLPIFGGDTTCVSIETADGYLLVLDGGSGIRNCSKHFSRLWPAGKPRELYIFGTHEHLDHRSGLPFSQFCYARPPFTMHVYAGYQFLHALDERYGVFSRQLSSSTHLDDPIDYRVMASSFTGHEMRNPRTPDYNGEAHPKYWDVRDSSQPVKIGETTITSFDVYHGTVRCLAYKFQHGPASFVFCTDHELRHGADPNDRRQKQSLEAEARVLENCRDVDAAYFDGQYFRTEYDGLKGIGVTPPVNHIDWGHSCIEDVMDRARICRIKHTIIGHHDPERTWVAKLEVERWLEKQCQGHPYKIELAKSEDVLEL